jgi:hypothetical protein
VLLTPQEERRNGRVGVTILAKAKSSGIKDVLLGKVEIPTSLNMIDEKTEEGKRLLGITIKELPSNLEIRNLALSFLPTAKIS